MKKIPRLVTLLATCLIAGCFFKTVQESDLVGKYEALLPDGGTETLELLQEGKCIQIIRLRDGNQYEAHGTWQVWWQRNRPRLMFKGIRESLTPTHEINPQIAGTPSGAIGTDVSRSLTGRVIINFTEDSYYRKVR